MVENVKTKFLKCLRSENGYRTKCLKNQMDCKHKRTKILQWLIEGKNTQETLVIKNVKKTANLRENDEKI